MGNQELSLEKKGEAVGRTKLGKCLRLKPPKYLIFKEKILDHSLGLSIINFIMLKIFCMFVVTKSYRRNPRLYFFNDKELFAKGSTSERLVHQFLELLVSPTAVTPHTNIFSMTKKEDFVTNSGCAKVTPSNSTTTVTLTQEFFNELEKVKTYDEEYGIVVNNLLEILKRQFSDIYEEMNELKIGYKDGYKLHSLLWQMQDLVKVIHERVETQMFIDVENLTYQIDDCLTKKGIA